jgi:hypothetical protein
MPMTLFDKSVRRLKKPDYFDSPVSEIWKWTAEVFLHFKHPQKNEIARQIFFRAAEKPKFIRDYRSRNFLVKFS